MLAELIVDEVDEFSGVAVPLPTIGKHIRERGFDHIDLITKKTGWTVKRILRRTNKAVQVGATAEARKKQAAGAYAINGTVDLEKEYLLVDDV